VLVRLVQGTTEGAITVDVEVTKPNLLGDAAASVVGVPTGGLSQPKAVLRSAPVSERHRPAGHVGLPRATRNGCWQPTVNSEISTTHSGRGYLAVDPTSALGQSSPPRLSATNSATANASMPTPGNASRCQAAGPTARTGNFLNGTSTRSIRRRDAALQRHTRRGGSLRKNRMQRWLVVDLPVDECLIGRAGDLQSFGGQRFSTSAVAALTTCRPK